MMERTHQPHQSTLGPERSSEHPPGQEQSENLVFVESTFYEENLPVANLTVGEIRSRFRDLFDIDSGTPAFLDGQPVSESVVVRPGQQLTFIRNSGAKGCSITTAVPL